ncbi:PREDICTED: uncharacterized protein LOC106742281 [Dinoponera quadriceps]|uniref:Uncharacterized protein LOC106742281 n=1 Tax=Dinoponera quadriceps TaxID=609295 RepID=A0A6P3WWQ2_DINQU|nr:PREDICTED: uncharacterized protein LOC106742281 [Dinoponera quadriceps]
MFAAILTLAFVVAHIAAEIPPYINVCSRRDPNLDRCLLENIKNLKNKICQGMPELSVPPTEPMHMDQIDVDTDNTKISFTNMYATGFCNYEVQSLHVDLEKQHVDIKIIFKQININTTCSFNVNVTKPVSMKGPIRITTDNVSAKAGIDLSMATEGNKEYVYLSNMDLDLDIKDYKTDVSSFNDGKIVQMQEISQKILGTNRQELLTVLKPNLEKIISKQILTFSNEIVKHFTYDELFPDHI